ncbi:SRPBCC domain-containing protein [Chitinophaga sp. NPDC101104]|uniref:SRPBCC domain-containing protein n=1 Tax=Chitinophaga sp. NPDC101104 TaxID=3390561 RepID=UPI003CFF8914
MYTQGAMIFADLTVANATELRDFYQAVIGWGSDGVPMKDGDEAYEDYMIKDANGEPVGGVCHARGGNTGIPQVWMLYMHVDDPEKSIEACEKGGGSVVKVVKTKEGRVHYAMLRDPLGTAFGIGNFAGSGGPGPAAKAAIQIGKTPEEVFEAIVDPAIMSNYFISQSSGRMTPGASLTWRFPEFDMDVPVQVKEVVAPSLVSFGWDVNGHELVCTLRLEPFADGKATVVKVEEASVEGYDPGKEWLIGNTEGWANFLACMKAWLEYGVHLRKGAFDFRFVK